MALDPKFQKCINVFFPRSKMLDPAFADTELGRFISQRLPQLAQAPLSLTEFNQINHIMHEGGVTEGYYRYYFLSCPKQHPYPLSKVNQLMPELNPKGIASVEQLDWGF